MENALVYFMITVISYPFLALSGAGAAFYRASGNAKFPTKVSVVSNAINVTGNALFIYGFQWGVAGAALATLLSRVFGTVVVFYFLRKPRQTLAITKPVTWLAGMETEAAQMCFELVVAMTVIKPLVWVGAFGLPYGLRAAGDVKFSMTASVCIMWGCRVALGIFLVKVFQLGLMAVWIGMFADWIVRAVIFTARFLNGKWIHDKIT